MRLPVARQLKDTVELQNGCACCTMKDELFNAVYELLSVAQVSDTTPDRAVMAVARVVASSTSCMDTSESASLLHGVEEHSTLR